MMRLIRFITGAAGGWLGQAGLWAAAAATIGLALLGIRWKLKNEGRREAEMEMRDADRDEADAVRRRVAAARERVRDPEDQRGYRDD